MDKRLLGDLGDPESSSFGLTCHFGVTSMLHFAQRLPSGAMDPSRRLEASVAPSASSTLVSATVEYLAPRRAPAAALSAVDSRLFAAFVS
jgi:hypothetical protein